MRSVFIVLFLLLFSYTIASAQLVINEVSQGVNGTKEYAELVVTGTRTCTDSCADLRGWVIDDNNGWLGSGSSQGIATGCMRFSNDNNWACVPYGSIILIYNDGDKNTSITLPDDPTDANKDYVYIVPANSTLFERNGSAPVSPSSPTYVYPTSGFSSGGSWSGLGLSNNGDAIILTSPANLGAPYFSVGFGNLNNSGTASIFKSTAGGAKVYYLATGQYSNASDWNVGEAPGNETPGVPNSSSNRQWIEDMRTTGAHVQTDIHACIIQGATYVFNGQTLSAAGTYTQTFPITAGCDSVVALHLAVLNPVMESQQLTGCGSVTYNGVTYTASAAITDTISSTYGCDSVYIMYDVIIDDTVPVTDTDTLRGCGQIRYNGTDYTSSGNINDTLRTRYGCDSVYLTIAIIILETPDLIVTPDTTICTGASVTLTAEGAPHINWEVLGANSSVIVTPEKTTTYKVWGQNENGCKDTTEVTVSVDDFYLFLTASDTQVIAGNRVQVQASGTRPFEVMSWMPSELFPIQTEKRQEWIANESRWITVTALSGNNCLDTASIFIEVLPDLPELYVPSAFSPNGDGLNEQFIIVGNYPVERFHIVIFDRWGTAIFESHNIQNSWGGLIRSQPADIGVYFYMIEATVRIIDETRSVFLKGDVTLIR